MIIPFILQDNLSVLMEGIRDYLPEQNEVALHKAISQVQSEHSSDAANFADILSLALYKFQVSPYTISPKAQFSAAIATGAEWNIFLILCSSNFQKYIGAFKKNVKIHSWIKLIYEKFCPLFCSWKSAIFYQETYNLLLKKNSKNK